MPLKRCLSLNLAQINQLILNLLIKTNMKKTVLFLFFVLIYQGVKAQLYYNFNNLTGAPTSGIPSGFTASNVVARNTDKIADFFTATSASDIYPGRSGGGNITTAARGGNFASDTTGRSYFTFSITPSTTERVRIEKISFGSRSISSSGGPTGYVIRSSVDNYSSNYAIENINSNAVWTLYNSSLTKLIIGEIGATVTIRIYANNGSAAFNTITNNWRIDDLRVFFTNGVGPKVDNFLIGQNAWLLEGFYAGSQRFGRLNSLWPTIKNSGVKMVRVGGIHAENNSFTAAQVINLVDSIRKIGAEPMVQVATGRGTLPATQAANLVQQVNTALGPLRKVKYWIIGNEPDLASHPPVVDAAGVANYIKSYSSAMKAVDPDILIVGPECASYNGNYYPALIGGSQDITGKDANGRYYIDIISFHTYPFTGTQTRQDVIDRGQRFSNNVDNLIALMNRADSIHGRTGTEKLKWALTEFNINSRNPLPRITANSVEGVGAHSFLNGQHWADVFNVGMRKGAFSIQPWSVYESGGTRDTFDLGYLDREIANNTIKPRSSYYHEQMIANNFKGDYIFTSNNQDNMVTTIGSFYNDTTSIMIANKSTSPYNFALQLNDKTINSQEALKINLLSNIDKLYIDQIADQSTIVLLFNRNGDLIKKTVYTILDAIATLAPTDTNYTLPLTWLDFNVKKETDGSVNLSWTVSDQVNTKSFEIERLNAIGEFVSIGFKPSTNQKGVTLYSFIDENPISGDNYYRIKQIDKDGKFSYSKTRHINLSIEGKDWLVYPNPIISQNTNLLINKDMEFVNYKLVDMTGKIIVEKRETKISSGTQLLINHGALAKGIYILQVSSNNGSSFTKLIVE
jgi:hypothetical protein